MDRRDLLAGFGVVLGSASLGGCLGRYGDAIGGAGETTDEAADDTTDAAGETTTDDTTDGTTDDATGETTAEARENSDARRPSVTGTQFELTGAGCGEPTGDASVGFREQSPSVVVTGTIPGSNQCYVAELVDANYDPDAGALVVTVASRQREGADVCAQCITQIDYEATVTFEGGLPEEVEVVHEAMDETTTVATVRAGETATTSGGTATDDD